MTVEANWLQQRRQRMPLICRRQSNTFILGSTVVPNDHTTQDRQIRSMTEHGHVSDDDGRV